MDQDFAIGANNILIREDAVELALSLAPLQRFEQGDVFLRLVAGEHQIPEPAARLASSAAMRALICSSVISEISLLTSMVWCSP